MSNSPREHFVLKFPIRDGTNEIRSWPAHREVQAAHGDEMHTAVTHPPRSAHDDATGIFPDSQSEPPDWQCCRGNGTLTAEEEEVAASGDKNGGRAAAGDRLESNDMAAV